MTTIADRRPTVSASVELAGRLGLMARGFVYLVVAALAVSVAREGHAEHEADTVGALAAVRDRPYGSALRAVVYLGLAAAAARVAMQGASASGAERQESVTATMLGWPGGRALVAVAGAVLVLVGVAEALNGITGWFMQQLREGELGDVSHRVVRLAGGIGHTGRGAAWVLVGAFVFQAALDHDPSKSRGLDGALAELAGKPYGQAFLLALALGLLAFGLLSIAEARWRRVRA